jgi:hypothetical protein
MRVHDVGVHVIDELDKLAYNPMIEPPALLYCPDFKTTPLRLLGVCVCLLPAPAERANHQVITMIPQ